MRSSFKFARAAAIALAATAIAFPASAADKKERIPPGGETFFTGKGEQPFALERVVPGINAVLMLSDDQIDKINTARAETIQSEAVQAAGRKVKTDPKATEQEKAEAAKHIAEARAKFTKQVADILSADQKKLIAALNEAHVDVTKEVHDQFEAQFVAAKGDAELTAKLRKEAQEEITKGIDRKLVGLLNAEQRKAMEKEAARQKKAAEDGRKKATNNIIEVLNKGAEG